MKHSTIVKIIWSACLALVFGAFSFLTHAQSTIRIDKSINYQKIMGFGAFEGGRGGDFYDANRTRIAGVSDAAHVAFLIDSLGYSAWHTPADNTIENINDDNDPDNYNWENFTYTRGAVADVNGVAGGCIRMDCQSVKLPGIVARQIYAIPNGFDKSCAGPNDPQMQHWVLAKAFRDHMIAKGDKPLMIARTWTSPAWMKYNNCLAGTSTFNTLIMDNIRTPEQDASASWSFYHDPRTGPNSTDVFPLDRKAEFAEYVTAHMILVSSIMGFSWDYMTLTNEPAFKQPYLSIGFSPLQHALAFYAVSKKMEKMRKDFANLNITTELAWSEDIGSPQRWRDYKLQIINNDSIRPYSYKAATTVHAYNSTGTSAGSTSTVLWNDMYVVSNIKGNRPFFMSETSCYGYGSYGLVQYMKSLYTGLKWGKNNAWIHWTGVLPSGDGFSPSTTGQSSEPEYYADELSSLSTDEHCYGLVTWPNNQSSPIHISKRMYGQAQYGRFVRPGSISVGCEVLKSNGTIDTLNPVLALAFQDNEKKKLSIVVTNTNPNASETVKLSFVGSNLDNPTSYAVYRTSETENLKYIETVSASTLQTTGYSFPRRSVTTFYGQNSEPVHVPVTKIEIYAPNYTNPVLSIPGTVKFSHTIYPFSATNQGVIWTVSDTTKASIDTLGNFRVRQAPSTVIVTARSKDNSSLSASLTLVINGRPDPITGLITTVIEPQGAEFYIFDPETGEQVTELKGIGREYGIAETFRPSSATIFGTEYTWEPQGVVVVDNGVVVPVGEGEVTLTGTYFSTDTISSKITLRVTGDVSSNKIKSTNNDLVVSVQPNPSNDYFIVKITSKVGGAYELSLTNIHGKTETSRVIQTSVGTTYQNIDVRGLSKGVYLLKVGANSQRVVIN